MVHRLIASRLSNKTSRKRPGQKPRVNLAGTRQETFTRECRPELQPLMARSATLKECRAVLVLSIPFGPDCLTQGPHIGRHAANICSPDTIVVRGIRAHLIRQ